MKVGILTFHNTTNYGATLQAYALWRTIQDQGYDAELIDYRPHSSTKYYQNPIKPIRLNNKNKIIVNRTAHRELLKYLKMRMFLLRNFRTSKYKTYTKDGLKNFAQLYDTVICGSDQIWCLDSFRGFDPSFFLDFIRSPSNCRKMSYAASFGRTESLGENKDLICELISHFDAVAVRDSNSLRVVQQECNRQATKVLDPTFLFNFDEIVSEPKFKRDYLIIYTHGGLTAEEEKLIKSIAEMKNLDIISLSSKNNSKIANKVLIGIGPKEWLGYIRKASYVVTNTYHGTIFSIIFRKLFTVLSLEGKGQKITDLLKDLGLEDRLILDRRAIECVKEEYLSINYNSVCEKLDKKILSSKTFLFEALAGKQGQK